MKSIIKHQLEYGHLLTIFNENCDGTDGVTIIISDYQYKKPRVEIFLNRKDIEILNSATKTLFLLENEKGV